MIHKSIVTNLSFLVLLIIPFIVLSNSSCRPEYISSSEKLFFSVDTLNFDTLIVGLLSETSKALIIYNPSHINVEDISLFIGSNGESGFSINVNGKQGLLHKHVRVKENDSLYIFVQAKIPVSTRIEPFFYALDSIELQSGNHSSKTILRVPIINAEYLSGELNEFELKSGKSYFVKDDILIPKDQILNINPGCSLYINNGANIIIEGAINAQGTKEFPILFSGARQGNMTNSIAYNQISGLWGKIWIKPSAQLSNINYCEIRNATVGLFIGDSIENVDRTLVSVTNAKILYNSTFNILGYNPELLIGNSLLSNSEQQLGVVGGKVKVIHCTITDDYEWSGSHIRNSVAIYDHDFLNSSNTATFPLDTIIAL